MNNCVLKYLVLEEIPKFILILKKSKNRAYVQREAKVLLFTDEAWVNAQSDPGSVWDEFSDFDNVVLSRQQQQKQQLD